MKKNFKGAAGLVLAAVLMAGCASGSSSAASGFSASAGTSAAAQTAQTAAQEQAQTETDTQQADAVATASGGPAQSDAVQPGRTGSHILVVYYSASNNTKAAAETIAQTAHADIFEIEPADPYTDDDLNWNDSDSRITREHEDESLQDIELVSTQAEDWDNYDTVFIGYPIWWGEAAWPVNNFIKDNDFSGKTVIPFCTSASSGIGSSADSLADMAGTGDWQEGKRFSGSASEAEIADWAQSVLSE